MVEAQGKLDIKSQYPWRPGETGSTSHRNVNIEEGWVFNN
jgi:hypothetical protein